MNIVLFSSDLTVVARVEGAAACAGGKLRTTSSLDQLATWRQAASVDLVIADLGMAEIDPAAIVKSAKQDVGEAPRIVAFGPHVHEERLAAARQAGCDEVVSRGQFFSQLEAILARAGAKRTGPSPPEK
jgi:CheY-like chemotaxis protein